MRLVALLDLSETRPLSASADLPKIGIADTKMGDRYRSPSDFSLIFLTVKYERMHRYFQLDLTLLFIRKLYISVLDCDLYIRIATLTLPVVETRGFSVLRGLPSRTDIVL